MTVSPVNSDAGEIRGAVLTPKGILTWGQSLALWPLQGGPPRIIDSGVNFGPAGTYHPKIGLFLLEDGHKLIRHRPRLVLEQETATHDCLCATIEGELGLLYIHQHAQLRFWSRAGTRELYSIYTPSRQSGLQFADLDGDGAAELFCGNYWLKPSGRRGVAWRLYAINTYFENQDSASARLLYLPQPKGLLWASAERAVWLTPGPDIRQLWTATPLELPWAGRPTCWLSSPFILLGHDKGVHSLSWTGSAWAARAVAEGFSCVALLSRDGLVWAVGSDGPRRIYPRK